MFLISDGQSLIVPLKVLAHQTLRWYVGNLFGTWKCSNIKSISSPQEPLLVVQIYRNSFPATIFLPSLICQTNKGLTFVFSLHDVFTLSVYASLKSSRSIGEGINSNLFHYLRQISELDSLLPFILEFLLLLLLLSIPVCSPVGDGYWEKGRSSRTYRRKKCSLVPGCASLKGLDFSRKQEKRYH